MCRIALRLLLCLMLVLNGTGYAVAATQMQMSHTTQALAAHEKTLAMQAADAMPPCHQAAQPDKVDQVAQSHSDSATGHSGSDLPECCQSSKCSCDYCLQHLTAAMSVVAMPATAPTDGAIAQPRVVHAVAPPLPNPLRPPIG